MSYLSAWAVVAIIAIVASLALGKNAGYGLVGAVIAFVVLAGAEKFGARFGKSGG